MHVVAYHVARVLKTGSTFAVGHSFVFYAMDCAVCFETDKTVACGCGFAACRSCVKKYLLGANDDAQCMSCRRGLTRADLVDMLGTTFVAGQYKKHREKVLYDRERALLPATQTRLANYRLAKSLMNDLAGKKAQLRVLKLRVEALTAEINADQVAFRRLVNTRYEDRRPVQPSGAAAVARPERIMCGCPKSGCNGFALASTSACGACETKICKHCFSMENEGHTCDPGDVETAKLIQKDTKPCPRCSVPIFRSSGCYQMFCTQCQCVFDWGNGQEIRNGAIHNPHYFEWLEKTGAGTRRRLPAAGCGGGGFGGVYTILRLVKFTKNVSEDAYRSMANRVRDAIHIQEVVIPRFHTPDIVRDNTVLRLRFLDNDITEKDFKTVLQRNEKRWSKEWELRQILEMYTEAVAAIVNNIGTFDENRDPATISARDVETAIGELDALDEYTNMQLCRMSKVFGASFHAITSFRDFTR